MRALGGGEDTLLIPVGLMQKTEENVRRDNRVELLFGTRQVQGTHGPGKGCGIRGRAEFQTAGAHFDAAKARFPWARAVMVVKVEEVKTQL